MIHKTFTTVLCLLAATLALLPLLFTPVLPLVDAYAHAVRYLVLSGQPLPANLDASYQPAWMLLPNLGMDVIGAGLMRILEPVAAMKVVGVLLILSPLLGVLALSAALHGQVTPFAMIIGAWLAIGHITIWGFTNFLFGLGAMLAAVAVWIILDRRPVLQWMSAIVIGALLILMHGVAFMFWGLILAGVEYARSREAYPEKVFAFKDLAWRGVRLLSLCILPLFIWQSVPTAEAEAGAIAGTIQNLMAHTEKGDLTQRLLQEAGDRIDKILRIGETGWLWMDWFLGAMFWGGVSWLLLTRRGHLHRLLLPPVIIVTVLVFLMPPSLFGVGYIADRVPLILALLLGAGITWPAKDMVQMRPVVLVMAGLLCLDAALTSVTWARQGRVYFEYLQAIDTIPSMLTANIAVLDNPGQRGAADAISCKPLSPLLALQKVAAVPVFAHATQQPLRIVGPLSDTQANYRATDRTTGAMVRSFQAGYDYLVTCRGKTGSLPGGAEVIAEGTQWRILANPNPRIAANHSN